MRLPPKSITGRLFFWIVACISGVLLAIGLFLSIEIETIVFASVDRMLHSKSQIVAGLLHEEHGSIELELSEVILGEYSIPRSGHYYKVMMNGKLLAASASLPDPGFNFDPATAGVSFDAIRREYLYQSVGPDNEPIRVLRQELTAYQASFNIIVAEDLRSSLEMVRRFKQCLLIAFPASILIIGAMAWWIVRRSLLPLRTMSSTIETITHKNLGDRIDAKAEVAELSGLADSFNEMLDRLQKVFENERRLIADASHELKTPLSVIKTQCDVVMQRARTGEEYVEALQTIRKVSDEIARLVNDLLSLARLDAGLMSPAEFTDLSLRACIEKAVRKAEPVAKERRVTIRTALDDAIDIAGHDSGLVEAFSNIIENGVRYNRDQGLVEVSAIKDGEMAIVSIRDTGVGIKAGDLEKIFERFYRADASRSTEGTGLGLSIARAVIKAHSGTITAESAPGKGSRFTVILPLVHKETG